MNASVSSVALENAHWACRLACEGSAVHAALNGQRGQKCLPAGAAVFCALDDGSVAEIAPVGPTEVRVQWGEGAPSLGLELDGPALRWRLDAAGVTGPVRAYFPYLARAFQAGGPGITLFTRASFRDAQGRLIFRHADWPLPAARVADNGETLTLLLERSPDPAALDPEDALTARGVWLQPGTPGVRGALILHEGGWPASFDWFRQAVRRQFNLAEYARPDLDWYQGQLVQHFTFLYGREIFNHETRQFEIDRFLDDAERDFGGYDGFLIWGVYPRIGVDERTQWDFYDDFPGGRDGLRAMARRARERGVRFFVPYKPWDRSADLHGRPGNPDSEELARLVADVEADGVFLDTLSAIDREFRAAIDRARPGVVFCSEGRAKGAAFETITGSWDQSPNRDPEQGNWCAAEEHLPGVDLWRFLFPEHRLFVINRHAVGDDRRRIIQRGFFSGMGWVVWQDIFGLVLTYSPEEAALLKRCRTLFRRHRQALASPNPTPLIPTLCDGVYCNEFPAANKRLWTFYNARDAAVSAAVLQVTARAATHFVDVWTDEPLALDAQGRLRLTLGPKAVGAVVEFPRWLAYAPEARRLHVAAAAQGAAVTLSQAGFEWSDAPEGDHLDLATTPIGAGQRVVARLVAGGEVLDQIVVD